MSGIVFINYRRKDAEHVAGRLFDRLEHDFSPDQLFFDVDSIPPGEDFVDYLTKQVDACNVLLAVVGPNWLSQLDKKDYEPGQQSKDFVRIEIEAALSKGKTVIPVLVGGTEMPREEDLPKALQPFARRNAVRLSHEQFKADTAGIINALKKALAEVARRRADEKLKVKAEREAKKEEKKKAARRDAVIAGLSAEQIAKAEELANWEFIKDSKSPQDFRDHLARFPRGVTHRMARANLELVVLKGLGERPSVEELDCFLVEFPDGKHHGSVKEQRNLLRAELDERNKQMEAAWKSASLTDTIEVYESFLQDWPRGPHSRAARTRFKQLIAAKERARERTQSEQRPPAAPTEKEASVLRLGHITYLLFITAIAVISAVVYWNYTRGREADQKPAPATQTSGGQYFVQIGAENDQTAALATFADIQQKYPSLIADYSPTMQKVDLGAKGISYRLRIGPMDEADAYSFCRQVKSQGWRHCLVMAR